MKTTCWSSNRASERGRKGFKWLNVEWLLVQTDWSEYFRNCWSTGIFTHNHLLGLQRMVWKRENIQWAAVVWMNMSCWCQRTEENGLVRNDRKTTVTQITTRYNQDLQNTISGHTTHRTLKQMGSSSRRPHRVPLLSDKNSTRRIQFTQSLDFCCNIQMLGSEFDVKNMKAWIHPVLSQWFRLVLVVV